MRVGVVGAGLQARRRLAVLPAEAELVAVADRDADKARGLTLRYGGAALGCWQRMLERTDVDAVLVCTPPDSHEEITTAALGSGRHVLCEKPLAASAGAAHRMEQAAATAGRVLYCGFNHRFHPAVRRLRQMVADHSYGRPLAAAGIYGYGVREGYRDEWRADPAVVSGGQLMEQGIHLVDLVDSGLWPVNEVVAQLQHNFGLNGLEDDAHLMLRSSAGQVAYLRSSLSQWRNRFLFEVTCERATLRVDGIGGSYGEQTLTVEERGDGPFQTHVTSFRGADVTWQCEWECFLSLCRQSPIAEPDAGGRRSLAIVEAAYRSVAVGGWTRVTEEAR
ncbi:Gfo/Idh/MocA family protein [Streptomyces sp. NPDC048751]|uniref:Gfo/Idh/MocA family protein n=1 Tax=Streptomyces sp. NPDC048751 TaxID=3365591 RepID=UPI00371772B0